MAFRKSEEVGMDQPLRIGRDRLAIAAIAFLAANLIHSADHVRQDFAGVNAAVFGGGTALTAAAVAVCVATLRAYPRAPLLAAIVGFEAAVLVAASHIAPHWSVLSDSYVNDIHPDALSWAVMLMEVAAGFALGVFGVHTLRAPARGAGDSSAPPERLAPTSTLQEV
jgi:hypothetical protein